jgi:hypothetical protein
MNITNDYLSFFGRSNLHFQNRGHFLKDFMMKDHLRRTKAGGHFVKDILDCYRQNLLLFRQLSSDENQYQILSPLPLFY